MPGLAAESDRVGDLGPRNLPWIPALEPLVGHLDLPAVPDLLIEDAELVAYPVADCGDLECRERVHVAGGEPSEPPVAEPGLFLARRELVVVLSEAGHGLAFTLGWGTWGVWWGICLVTWSAALFALFWGWKKIGRTLPDAAKI